MIRYDRSPSSIIVMCSCGWREITLTKQGAWRVAVSHEEGSHPGRYQVRNAASKREERRRTEDDGNDPA